MTREVTTNKQTGEKTYGDWTKAQFAEYVVPTIEGHVSSVDKVEQSEVTGDSTDLEYHINYLAHQVEAEKKTVNRVIKVTMPDGTTKTITQTVIFVKHVTKHPVTGEVIRETGWSVDGSPVWDEFIPEKIAGYTPSQEKVAAMTPDVNTGDVLVEISYQQNEKPTEPDTPVSPEQPGDSDKPVDSDKPAGSTNSTGTDQQGSGSSGSAAAAMSAGNAAMVNASPVNAQLVSVMGTGQSKVKEMPVKNTDKTTQNNRQLPQTGEQETSGVVAGTMLVLVTLLLQIMTFGLVKRKEKTE